MNTTLRRYRGQNYTGWVHSDIDPQHRALDHPEEFVNGTPQLLLDCENRKIVRLLIDLRGYPTPVLLHFSCDRSLRRIFRRNYAIRILDISQKLTQRSIPTVQVLAALRKKGEPLNGTSLVIARELQHVEQLPSRGKHQLPLKPTVELTGPLIRLLADTIAHLHSSNLFHGDLKSRHILLDREAPPKLILVDLEKSVYLPYAPAWLMDGFAARDLVQLLSSLGPSNSHDEERSGQLLLTRYLESRGLSKRRRQRIHSWIGLYLNSGGFEQGKTVLENLLVMLKKRPTERTPVDRKGF